MMVTLFGIEGAVDTDRFKVAIAEAMNRHEQLKSKITLKADGEAYYEPISRAVVKVDIEKYEPAESDDEESLMDIAFEWADEAVCFSLDLSSGELMRHLILSDGETAVWGIASHYLAGDAPSLQYFARDVFALLEDSQLKLKPLAWQAPDESDVPGEDSLSWPAKFKVKKINKLWRREEKSFSWPDLSRMEKNFHEAYPMYILHTDLEPEVTAALRELARRENVHFVSLFAAAYAKATAEKDTQSVSLSTRPPQYEGVGTYQGSIGLDLSKIRGEHSLTSVAKILSEQMTNNMKDPEKVHHAHIVLLGMDETLIDAGYYQAYDGLDSKAAEMMRQLYGLADVGSGTQLSNLGIIPAKESYAFGEINEVYLIPPLAPNFTRSISLATAGGHMGIIVSFYQDEAYENFLLEKTIGMLKEAVGFAPEETEEL